MFVPFRTFVSIILNNMKKAKSAISILLLIAAFDVFVWYSIALGGVDGNLRLYYLNVGQGDGQLIKLPGGAKFLIDGGPNSGVINQLAGDLSNFDRYIDLVIVTHTDADHLSGLLDVVRRYKVGAVIWNGREGETDVWRSFVKAVNDKKIPVIVLGEGDKISYGESKLDILAPAPEFLSGASNEAAIITMLTSKNIKALFTSDATPEVEARLVQKYDIKADILKVAHHGSRFSSTADFLNAVKPKVSVIQVGKNNYGHPTAEVLARLKDIGSSLYRNDINGAVEILVDGKSAKVVTGI